MDFLNRGFAQVSELFRSMAPGARITAGLLLGVIVVSLAFLFRFSSSTPDSYLVVQGRTPEELARMQAAFDAAKLTGSQVDGGRIRVPRGQEDKYMAALVSAGALPHNFGDYWTAALDNSNSFTPKQKQAEMVKVAKLRELSRWFSGIPGVDSAAVFYDIEERPTFGQPRAITASVNLSTSSGSRLTNEQIANIRNTMLGAIAGLRAQNLQITDQAGHRYSAGGDDLASSGDDAFFNRKQQYERDLEEKVLASLEMIRGVQVKATAELNPETRHQEEKRHIDPKPVALQLSEMTSVLTTQGQAPQGPPGVRAQQPNQPATLGQSAAPRSESEESRTEKQSVASTDTTLRDFAPLTLRDAKVAITIPASYFVSVWREQNQAAAGAAVKEPTPADLQKVRTEVTTKVEELVNGLLPDYPLGKDPYPRVKVVEFQDLAPIATPMPAFTEHFLSWMNQHWTTVGMFLLGFVSLMMLRSMIRATPVEETLGRVLPSTLSLAPTPAMAEPQQENKPRLKRRVAQGSNLRDELTEMVREDPDSAATILRSWIGNAS
jgi:flagellar M-ring protein FliF